MDSHNRDVRFDRTAFGAHRHICAFFNSAEEEARVLTPFIKEGLNNGEKSLHIVDPAARDAYLTRIRTSDIPVDASIAAGQLEVVPWDQAHLRSGRFDQYAMLAWADDVLTKAAACAGARLVAHMEWALLDLPGVEDLLEYETRVNHMMRKHDVPVVCAYDATRFNAGVAMDIMRTHPLVIIGGVLQENPFYVSPDELLEEIRAARSRQLPSARAHPTAVSAT